MSDFADGIPIATLPPPPSSCPTSSSQRQPIQFQQWYPVYRKQSIKSLVVELPQTFVSYIQDEDSIHLPPDVISAATGDHLSDDEELHEVDEEEEVITTTTSGPTSSSSTSTNSFQDLNDQLRRAIQGLNGAVFIKMNWKCPKDASWINGGTLKCLNLEHIYLLLKSSSRVTDVIDTIRDHENRCSRDNFQTIHEVNRDNFMPTYSLILRKWSNLHPSMVMCSIL